MKYVNLTPRWSEILPHWLLMYHQAARGQADDPVKILEQAEVEFKRMAQGADNYNDLIALLRKRFSWSDKVIDNALKEGREITELERTEIKESEDDLPVT